MQPAAGSAGLNKTRLCNRRDLEGLPRTGLRIRRGLSQAGWIVRFTVMRHAPE